MNIAAGVENYLSEVRIPIRLACTTPSGWPAVVSLWYLYEGGQMYCATQQNAKIVSYLRENSRCGFEIAADMPPYCGVRGQGIARIDAGLGATVLQQLLVRYLGDTKNLLAQQLMARKQTEVAIVIEPVNIFTWNYTDRMKDSLPGQSISKLCPE